MAGPPLVPLSSTKMNANVQKEGEREDQPCPKRRRKSIDEQSKDVADGTPSPTAATTAQGSQQGAPTEPRTSGSRGEERQDSTDDGDAVADADADDATSPSAVKGGTSGAVGGAPAEGGEASTADADTDPTNNTDTADLKGTEGSDEEEEEEEEDERGEEDQEEEEEEGGAGGEGAGGASSSKNGEKPDGSKIARARSAWMLFLADNREKVRKEHPGLAVGPMQKILSEMWKALEEDDVARYAKLAAEDKERMKSELAAAGLTRLPAKNSNASTSVPGGPTSLVLPLARVRKTVRLDPAVGNISKEGLLLVTKATEVFMAFMADHAWKIGRQTGRKSVRPCDVADFVFTSPEMYWLKDEFRDQRSSVKKHSKPDAGGAKSAGVAGKTGVVAVPKVANPITSFFKKA